MTTSNSGSDYNRDMDIEGGYTSKGADTDESISQLNSLLRGEISAAETYRMAIDKVADSDTSHAASVGLLREIQEEHGRAAPGSATGSGSSAATLPIRPAPGASGRKPSRAPPIFSATPRSLKSLKEGEEHGLKDYQEAIDDLDMNSVSSSRTNSFPPSSATSICWTSWSTPSAGRERRTRKQGIHPIAGRDRSATPCSSFVCNPVASPAHCR